jgi:hypothetical protein
MTRQQDDTKGSTPARRLWEWWKRVGKRIGDLQARALLMLFYFVILAPFALAVRWAGDPLAIKAGSPKGWRPGSAHQGSSMERAAAQF